MSIYKAFKNIWMIVLNILGYFSRNKQNNYAALIIHLILKNHVRCADMPHSPLAILSGFHDIPQNISVGFTDVIN